MPVKRCCGCGASLKAAFRSVTQRHNLTTVQQETDLYKTNTGLYQGSIPAHNFCCPSVAQCLPREFFFLTPCLISRLRVRGCHFINTHVGWAAVKDSDTEPWEKRVIPRENPGLGDAEHPSPSSCPSCSAAGPISSSHQGILEDAVGYTCVH